ncbi:hypothetical protein SAMN05421736_10693 [Evansella caseinilytica]|uniref:Uncharacterized protein n=1 Tax=Evansella caseinilytica TaxID=1503961 RepID=A0A1H3QA78_9BACI|nr:hypothetical protein [Evansella caseinilytica]SDZ10464.1 hypothetical protein SAMN05421736_10693 [Evansella caseinilytica]
MTMLSVTTVKEIAKKFAETPIDTWIAADAPIAVKYGVETIAAEIAGQ